MTASGAAVAGGRVGGCLSLKLQPEPVHADSLELTDAMSGERIGLVVDASRPKFKWHPG
jgi:hypothetical protein